MPDDDRGPAWSPRRGQGPEGGHLDGQLQAELCPLPPSPSSFPESQLQVSSLRLSLSSLAVNDHSDGAIPFC